MQSRCSSGEISEKPSWKLQNVVSTIKTISNINTVFSNCFTNEIHICNFFTIDEVLVGKVTISASLKEIHFPKISEQAPLKIYIKFSVKRVKLCVDVTQLMRCGQY